MKHSIKSLIFLLIFAFSCENKDSVLIDSEGNSYTIKDYDGTWWMTENFKGRKDKDGNSIIYYFPNEDSNNVNEYGLLYDYETACKICPDGWQLPTNTDWEKLLFADADSSAIAFKDVNFWEEEVNTNNSQFSVKPTGYGNNGEFDNFFLSRTYFWSKTDREEDIWTFIFEKGKNKIRKAEQHPTYAFAVRCIKR